MPLVSSGKSTDGKRKHLMITPLFSKREGDDFRKVSFFPVFNYKTDNASKSNFNIFYVLFRRSREGEKISSHFLWPLCEHSRDINYKYFRFAPVVWYKKSVDSRYFSIQPFYYHYADKEYETFNIFWQLYTHQNYFDHKKSRNFLWKLIFWDRYENKDYEFRFLHLVVANVKKEGAIEKSFFPFYHKTKQSNGDKSLSLLLYLFNTSKRQVSGTNEFYNEIRIFWFIRLLSNHKNLVEKGVLEPRRKRKPSN